MWLVQVKTVNMKNYNYKYFHPDVLCFLTYKQASPYKITTVLKYVFFFNK